MTYLISTYASRERQLFPKKGHPTGFLAANDLSPHYSITGSTMIAFQ